MSLTDRPIFALIIRKLHMNDFTNSIVRNHFDHHLARLYQESTDEIFIWLKKFILNRYFRSLFYTLNDNFHFSASIPFHLDILYPITSNFVHTYPLVRFTE